MYVILCWRRENMFLFRNVSLLLFLWRSMAIHTCISSIIIIDSILSIDHLLASMRRDDLHQFARILFRCHIDNCFFLVIHPTWITTISINRTQHTDGDLFSWKYIRATYLRRIFSGSMPSSLSKQHSCKAVLPRLKNNRTKRIHVYVIVE